MKYTTDIWFVTYLVESKGYKIHNYEITSNHRGKFYFSMDSDTWMKEKLEFVNSDISRYKQFQEKLKDLLY